MTSYTKTQLENLNANLSVWEKAKRIVPIKKETENGKIITYRKKMIESVKRLAGSLSSLADSLNEGLHKNK